MGNRVVVGTDGSSSSRAAVETAAREALRRRAELRVVYALNWPVRPMYAPLDTTPLDRLLAEAADRARSVAPEVAVTEAMVPGDTVSVLEAESRTAELLVLGARGAGGFLGLLLGSTAASVTAHSQCPVMVTREGSADTGPIMLCVDGSPAGERAIEFAFAEAALRGAEIDAVHVWLPDYAPAGTGVEGPERLLAQALAGHAERHPDVTVRREVASGEAREVLIEKSRSAQLVVVGARGRGGFTGLLLGSVSQALLHHAHSSVVVVRGQA
ncbi:universal stress protein [Streptomyces sp. 15-116A]|uniref:universal stress protein n=1 Tax=Streptomyces sp. 15-116A TaxID=2259035 RepID=UPI0021B46735|nr:universal stress protein [Streptomyces sp. 15-116A]MCT7355168.1 universal stress protein [Streptomyces sp. 15-116A]